MRVYIGCERSGQLRRAFQQAGHYAVSIDTEPADDGVRGLGESGGHLQGDLFDMLLRMVYVPDLFIVHPPCTYLCSSGLHWNQRVPGRATHTTAALAFVSRCWELPFERVVLENPQGCINTRLPFMPRPQYVQPYMFGDDASKKTGLWLRGVPPLQLPRPDQWVMPRYVRSASGTMLPRWSNQTDSGQNKLPPSPDRAKQRSETYPGIARAFVTQWGNLT